MWLSNPKDFPIMFRLAVAAAAADNDNIMIMIMMIIYKPVVHTNTVYKTHN
jgi:hypothetical protein